MLGLKLLHISKTIWFHDKYITMSMLFVWGKPKIRTTYTKGNKYISYISLLRCYIWWLEIKARPLTVRWERFTTLDDLLRSIFVISANHDDVIKWKHFPRYWPIVRSPVNSPHKGQWRGALMFFYYLCLNKRLSIQWRRRRFETPSRSLWRQFNECKQRSFSIRRQTLC